VAQILGLMNDLSASSIADSPATDTGLDKSNLIIEADGQNLKRILTIGQAKPAGSQPSNEFYAKTNQNDNIFLIRQDQRDILNVGLKELKN
jgi:hypothetical protein